MLAWIKRNARHLPAILGVFLLIGAVYAVQHQFRTLKVDEVKRTLEHFPRSAIVIAALWTVASYGVLTFYDRLGTIYAGHRVSYARAAFASFCAYALSHNLGFAAVSGAAVRYRLYSNWGLQPVEIAKVVAFCSLTFGLGGMMLGAAIMFFEPTAVPYFGTHLPLWGLYGIGCVLFAIPSAYVAVSSVMPVLRLRGKEIELPHWRMALIQVAVATLDVAVTASIFYALVPHTHGLTYVRLLAVYLSCYTAGLVATIPGGLGVFDGAMLFGLGPYMPAPQIVGAILIFRLYYYIIPLFLAGSMFAGNEVVLRGRGILGKGAPIPTRGHWSEPDIAVAAATGAVAICGFLLVCLGVLERKPDFSWIDPDFGEVMAQAGEFVPSLIGAALLVTAAGLSRRVNLAWGATLALLVAGAGLLVAQGEPLWMVALLAVAALLVVPYRSAFYRHSRLLAGPLTADVALPLAIFVACVLLLPLFEKHVRWIGDDSFWNVILSPSLSNSLRASVAVVVLLGLGALWRLLRPGRVTWLPWGMEAHRRYAALGEAPPLMADGLVLGEAGRAGIAFRRVGQVMLGLGDPVGAPPDRASAVWRLRDLAAQEKLEPAIWGAADAMRSVYEAMGLSAVPLDDDGRPDAGGSNLSRGPATRYLMCTADHVVPALSDIAAELSHPPRRIPA